MEHERGSLTKAQFQMAADGAESKCGGCVKLIHAEGMHARPAVKLTKLAKRFRSCIVVRVVGGADWVDAKSVTKVMAMRAPCDSTIEIVATGADAGAAVDALIGLVANDFAASDGGL